MTLDSFLNAVGNNLSQGTIWSYAIAFVAGILASAVCPCTLPMGLGMASVVGSAETREKKSGLPIAIMFFLGIVLNLTLLGALAARLGEILTETFGRYWALSMALVSLLAAIAAFLGPRLQVSQLEGLRRPGQLGAFIYGFVFSLGTSAAPLLLLLTVAAGQREIKGGLILAVIFGVGRGLPFLLVGLFAGLVTKFTELSLWRKPIQALSGLSLIIVGAYYLKVFFALS